MSYLDPATIQMLHKLDRDRREALDDHAKTPDTDGLQTLLDQLETSVDHASPKASAELRESANAHAENLRTWSATGRYAARADAIERCSEQYILMMVDGEYRVHPIRCRQRDCPICAEARRSRWYYRLRRTVKLWTAPKHITLTIKSSADPLDEQLDRLIAAYRRLRQTRLFKHSNIWGYWIIEITYNEQTGLFHPHLHIIGNCGFIPIVAMREAWYRATGDSYMVYIRTVKSNIARYLCKYLAKSSSVFDAPVNPFLVLQQLKGKRFAQKFGKWPKTAKVEPPDVIVFGRLDKILLHAAQGDQVAQYLAGLLSTQFPTALARHFRHRFHRILRPDCV